MATVTADDVRQHVIDRLDFFGPLRDGQRVICAGEVVRSMKLVRRTRLVCSSLASREFQRRTGLRWIPPRPKDSMKALFVYVPDENGRYSSVATQDTGSMVTAEKHTARSSHRETASERADLPRAKLCLVSCVATKLTQVALAKDLYISDWFKKARRVVETEGWRWFVLSAKHGLLDPEEPIAPYEKTLDTMSAAERRWWASEVWTALEPHLAEVRSVVFFAGRKYREHLESRLRGHGLDVQVPMEGLDRGNQLAWFKRRLDRQ